MRKGNKQSEPDAQYEYNLKEQKYYFNRVKCVSQIQGNNQVENMLCQNQMK